MPTDTCHGLMYTKDVDDNITCDQLDTTLTTVKNAVVDICDNPAGGIARQAYAETSGVNANNKVRIGYVVVSGDPTPDVTWNDEGGTTPSVTISTEGGVIRILDLFSTYENTNGNSVSLTTIINGVGDEEFDAVPIIQKIYHNKEFTEANPSAQLYVDQDNTPGVQVFGYSATSPGTIKVYLTNISSSTRFAINAIWKLNEVSNES